MKRPYRLNINGRYYASFSTLQKAYAKAKKMYEDHNVWSYEVINKKINRPIPLNKFLWNSIAERLPLAA